MIGYSSLFSFLGFGSGPFFYPKDQHNLLTCSTLRIVLLLYLILAKHAYFVVEQPSGSLLHKHRRWEKFANQTAYVPCIKLPIIYHTGCMFFVICKLGHVYPRSGRSAFG